jgi:1,4-alpha-glucan branching enzyme
VTTWGTPRTLATWSAPGAQGLAWRQRAAELRVVAAAGASDRALRELLALQSSDWAFLASNGTAGPYPLERADGHELALAGALADPSIEPRLRNLAPHLAAAALREP